MKKFRHKTICFFVLCLVILLAGSVSGFAAEGAGAEGADMQVQAAEASAAMGADMETPATEDPAMEDPATEDPAAEDPAGDPSNEEEPVTPAVTKISGMPGKLSKDASATVKITVKVTPANDPRVVKLQQYDSVNKEWITRATYHVENQDKAAITVTLAKKYRKKTTGKWRVFVPATEQAQEAVSKVCTVTSRNVVTKSLSARSACIYCIDNGNVIYTKKYKTRRSPASTTKLMTSVILVESGKLKEKTSISANAANTPWGSGHLRKGDKYRNIDLLYAMLLPSANDAAVAVAEGVSGSTGKFVKRMNKKAEKMGLENTHFCNPHGLNDSNHYTTAFELAKLTAYAYDKEEIRKAMKTKSRTIKSLRYKSKWTLYSSDTLLGKIQNFFGGKTGTGSDAKYCFTGIYKHKKKTYVTVVLGAGSPAGRWSDTKKLHSYIRSYAATKY